MERIFMFVLVLVLADGFDCHPKFPPEPLQDHNLRKVVCNKTHDDQRNKFIEKSKCQPKEWFVPLTLSKSYLEVSPSSVWVKRCIGICDFSGTSKASECTPTKIRMEPIPVRVHNLKTHKDSCMLLEVEVHEECRCCPNSERDCVAPRVLNPRKCSCQCPNSEERRACLKKRNQNLRWNRYKCACEQKRRTTW